MNVKAVLKVLSPIILVTMQAFTNSSADEVVIDHSLYPPLSTGEASPWKNPDEKDEKAGAVSPNPWSAQQGVPPRQPVQPYAGYQPQYVNPGQYGYPQQGYYPNQRAIPIYPQMQPMIPYGYGIPNNGYGGYFPPSGFGNGWNYGRPYNNGPFDFSMPWPF